MLSRVNLESFSVMSGIKINTKEDAFRLFDEAVKALTESKFILTQKPITDILRCLVLNEQLHAFVSDCCKGVNYNEELQSCFRSSDGGYSFILPKSNKKIIAITTGLLSDFDKGDINLISFIKEMYPDKDSNISYKLFCENILWAFHRAFRQSFLYDIDSADSSGDMENSTNINQTVLDQTATILAGLRTIFVGDNKLNNDKRNNLLILVDGLYYSLEKGDLRIIKTVWTGLKLGLTGYKKAEKKFSEISEILALYALL